MEQLSVFDFIENTDKTEETKILTTFSEKKAKAPKTQRIKIHESEDQYCVFCGRGEAKKHHLIFGTGLREKADEDGIFIYACSACHVTGERVEDRIHDNPMAEKLSKMLGQVMWEKNYIEEHGCSADDAKYAFIQRYGRGYI